MSTIEERLATLERRLQALEDEREIARLIASYGPLVDAGAAEEAAALWTEDGVYDVDEVYLEGRDQLKAMVLSAHHQQWIEAGCAHFLGPAHITVDGDSATAVCHSLMVVRVEGRFVLRRATANHWSLSRTPQGWRTTRRTSRVLDGRAEAIDALLQGVRGVALSSAGGPRP